MPGRGEARLGATLVLQAGNQAQCGKGPWTRGGGPSTPRTLLVPQVGLWGLRNPPLSCSRASLGLLDAYLGGGLTLRLSYGPISAEEVDSWARPQIRGSYVLISAAPGGART